MAQRRPLVSRRVTCSATSASETSREHHALRPRAARGGTAGRARSGDRRAARARDRRDEHREDFYWTLASVFLDRREQFEVFDQAFHVFWRDPQLLERVMALLLPTRAGPRRRRPRSRRPPTASPMRSRPRLAATRTPSASHRRARDRRDASPSPSASCCSDADFETMTTRGAGAGEEADRAAAAADPRGAHAPADGRTRTARRVDLRSTLRASLRGSADVIPLQPPLAAAAPSAAGRPVRHLRLA